MKKKRITLVVMLALACVFCLVSCTTTKPAGSEEPAQESQSTHKVSISIDGTGEGTLFLVDGKNESELKNNSILDVESGKTLTVRWEVAKDSFLASLLVDGKDQDDEKNEREIGPITKDMTIAATFDSYSAESAPQTNVPAAGVYVGDFVDAMKTALDQKGIDYELGSKMGDNQKADFEAGIYGFPFFSAERFFCIAMTDETDTVESVECTLQGGGALDDTQRTVLKTAIGSFDSSLQTKAEDIVQKIIDGQTDFSEGNVNILVARNTDPEGMTVTITKSVL